MLVGLLLLGGCAGSSRDPAGPTLSASEEVLARQLIRAAGVDPSRVDPAHRRRLVSLANDQNCPCPERRGSLAECADRGSRCVQGPFAARAILRGVLRGDTDEAINARLLERFGPRAPEEIALADVPCRGNPQAAVVMVVFSDFQCPFCAMAAKLVEELQRHAGERLRVCFMHWPLQRIHPKAQLAAQAAVAAQLQDKFWPMHDRLFAHQKELEREDLLEHAGELGLDAKRFVEDLDSERVVQRVARDAKTAAGLNLEGTPSFFINGRRMTDPKTIPDFLDWIAEEIALQKRGAK